MTQPLDLESPSTPTVRWCAATTSKAPVKGLQVTTPTELDAFGTLRAVLMAAMATSGCDFNALVSGHEESLSLTVPDLLGLEQKHRGHFYNAENVGSSVIRRISRESIHLTDAIDDLALLLLDLIDYHGGEFMLVGAEYLDRPTARVIYRAYQLAEPCRVRWTWQFSHSVLSGSTYDVSDEIERRYRDSRERLFRVLAERMEVSIENGIQDLPVLPFEGVDCSEQAVTLISQALVGQNYDFAYVNAAINLDKLKPKDCSNIWRMLCIADANMGRIDDAVASIDHALASASDDPWLSAQCLYMRGLLETKRRYDLDAAEDAYLQALQIMDHCNPRDERTRVERAWATNGLALVHILRTKQLDPGVREVKQMQIFLDEAEAFKDVSQLSTAQALYLQLNLLANMTLLLEVMGDYSRAVSFWGRVFEKFRGTNSAERRSFEVAFLYRLGLLELKAGFPEQARSTISRALEVPDVASRSFTFERLMYAKGHIELSCGDYIAAGESFATGCELAFRLRHDEALSEHLAGLAEANIVAPHKSFQRWTQIAASRGVVKAEKRSLPSPKFPSYVPLVDLEVAPQIDLNRFLADDRSGQSLNSVLGRH